MFDPPSDHRKGGFFELYTVSSAWGDSDESAKSTFQSFSHTARYLRLRAEGTETDYKELHFHLVGAAPEFRTWSGPRIPTPS